MSTQSDLVLDRTRRLLTYLAAVSRELTVRPVRDVGQHREAPQLVPGGVPSHPQVRLGQPTRDRPAWLTVQKVAAPVPPAPAPDLAGHLEPGSVQPDAVPRLRTPPPGRPEAENDRLSALFDHWLSSTWQPWIESSRSAREARRLYETLFTLELDADRLKASHELFWGHSLLSWRVADQEVRYPLLLTSVVIHLDETDGTISVLPDGPTELQLNPLEGLSLPMIDDLSRLQERLRREQLDPWNTESLAAVHAQLIAPLGLDARIGDGDIVPVPAAAPVITDSWVLALRARPTRHDRFYRELAELLHDGSVLPQALAAVVADDDQVRLAQAEFGQPGNEAWQPVGERLLMPLPANAEQERIARQLARDRGVTVQGPPGTGKSHTIANLVSHLLAHGKRVLVTAQNEQALTVLRDKIPAELRDLSIAVLGSSSESMEQLRGSAQAVMDIASSVDEATEAGAVVALGDQLDLLRERLRQAELAVLAALRTEDAEYPLPGGPTRTPDVARWLTEHEAQLDKIPDPLAVHAVLPLDPQELQQLFDLSAGLTPPDVAALGTHRPPAADLPTASQLAERAARIDALRQDIGDLEQQGLAIAAIDLTPPDRLEQVQIYARKNAEYVATLEEAWLLQLRAGMRDSPELTRSWVEQSAQLTDRVAGASELQRKLMGQDIKLPDGDYRAQRELFDQLLERFSEGKGLPRLGGGELKRLHAETTINGLPLRTPEEVRLVGVQLTLGVELQFMQRLVEQLASQLPIPIPQPGPGLLRDLDAVSRKLAAAVSWQVQGLPNVYAALRPFIPSLSDDPTSAQLADLAQLLVEAGRRKQERQLDGEHQALIDALEAGAGAPAASPLWTALRTGLESRNWQLWSRSVAEAARLTGLEGPCRRRNELARKLAAAAPAWAGAIVRSCADPTVVGRPEEAEQYWSWRRAETWLGSLLRQADLKRLQSEVLRLQQEEQALVLQIARRGAAVGLKRNLKDVNRRALSSWLNALGKLGKGTGKYSAHWQVEARSYLPAAMGAVPVWIMPVHRVIENFDPRVADLFDVVIVDESSQCDLLSVGILALGAKAVVVGDDRQTSPAAVGVNRDRIMQLQETYLSDVTEKSLLTADESLYALSERIFPSTILLREHFRSVPEIIDFSDDRYYNGEILPLREPSRAAIGEPLRGVFVAGACTSAASVDRVNRIEAAALVDQVAACNGDPAYDGLTFGIVTMLGAAQGPLIEGLLRERLGVEAFARRRLRVGNPAAFQGDERNIVFISMVADDGKWAATKRSDAQRVNVAASRAQDQLWVFHSVDPELLHAEDERRALLEYVRDTGSREVQLLDLESRCESRFERDVLRELVRRDYQLQVQHRVGRYRIDLVVVGENSRLAIECDGDSFHGPEQWEDDLRRQRQLERLGWTFWRIRASEFYRERAETLASLEERLVELEIRPRGLWPQPEPKLFVPEPVAANLGAAATIGAEPPVIAVAVGQPEAGTEVRAEGDESAPRTSTTDPLDREPISPRPVASTRSRFDPRPAAAGPHSLGELLTLFDLSPDFTDRSATDADQEAPASNPRNIRAKTAYRSPRAAPRMPDAGSGQPDRGSPSDGRPEPKDVLGLDDTVTSDQEVFGSGEDVSVVNEPFRPEDLLKQDDVPAPEPALRTPAPKPSRESTSNPAGRRTSGPTVPVPEGYRQVGWIRPYEAAAAMDAYLGERDVVVRNDLGVDAGLARFHQADDPEALKYRAQVALLRRGNAGLRIVAWLRDYEAEAIVTAASIADDLPVDQDDWQTSCLVEYFDPASPEAAVYRSVTRLHRRKSTARNDASATKPNDPEPLTIAVERDRVEAADLGPVQTMLNRCTSSAPEMLHAREQVRLTFDDYHDEPRALSDIPEVRDYVRALDGDFPYWLFFLSRDTPSLATLLRCLLPTPAGTEDFRTALRAGLETRWFPAMTAMAEKAGLGSAEIEAMTARTVDYIVSGRRR